MLEQVLRNCRHLEELNLAGVHIHSEDLGTSLVNVLTSVDISRTYPRKMTSVLSDPIPWYVLQCISLYNMILDNLSTRNSAIPATVLLHFANLCLSN